MDYQTALVGKRLKLSKSEGEESLQSCEYLKNRKLLIFDDSKIVLLDFSKSTPRSFVTSLLPHIRGGFFSHNNKIFVVGGGDFNLMVRLPHRVYSEKVLPSHVDEVMFNCDPLSSDLSSQIPPLELVPTNSFGHLNYPKPSAHVIPFGHKVYVLEGKFCLDCKESVFEVLDLDHDHIWKTFSMPDFSHYRLNSDYLSIAGYYGVGSKLYVKFSQRARELVCYYCFDTQSQSWEDVTAVLESWFTDVLLGVPTLAYVVAVSKLKRSVILSYHYAYAGKSRKNRELVAILVTDVGRPLCYQVLTDSMLHLPSKSRNEFIGFSDLRDGSKCLIYTYMMPGVSRYTLCLFDLIPMGAAKHFDDLPESAISDGFVPKEEEFLDVKIHTQYDSKNTHDFTELVTAILV